MRADRKDILRLPRRTFAYSVFPGKRNEAAGKDEGAPLPALRRKHLWLPGGAYPLALYGEGEAPLVYASDKTLYRSSGISADAVTEAFVSVPVRAAWSAEGEAVELLSDGTLTLAVRGTVAEETLLPGADALVRSGDRMFLAKGSRIYYTDTLPAAPYAAAGYLELPAEHGRVSALAACGEDVLCFCERSAFRLSARGGESAFSLSPLSAPLCGGESSPVAFAGKVYWRSGGRLWSYDGARALRAALPETAEGPLAAGGRFLLAGGTVGGERGVLCLDAAGEAYFFPGKYGLLAAAFGGSAFLPRSCSCDVPAGAVGKRAAAPSSAAAGGWSSGMLRLGRRGAKRLSAVEVAAERAFSLEIVSDCCRMRFSLPAGESVVRPDMAGEAFSFSVNVGEEALSALTAIYSMNA